MAVRRQHVRSIHACPTPSNPVSIRRLQHQTIASTHAPSHAQQAWSPAVSAPGTYHSNQRTRSADNASPCSNGVSGKPGSMSPGICVEVEFRGCPNLNCQDLSPCFPTSRVPCCWKTPEHAAIAKSWERSLAVPLPPGFQTLEMFLACLLPRCVAGFDHFRIHFRGHAPTRTQPITSAHKPCDR